MHAYNVTKKALAIPALALLFSQASAEPANPPKPTVADVIKASNPRNGARWTQNTRCTWTCPPAAW